MNHGLTGTPGGALASAGKGLFEDQIPFRPDLTLSDLRATLSALGLERLLVVNEKALEAIAAIIANLAILPTNYRLFYSRDKTHYSDMRRYRPPFYTYGTMLWAVERLASLGVIEHWPTPRRPYPTFRSSIRPSAELLVGLQMLGATDLKIEARECIILRDEDGAPVGYRENSFTRKARAGVGAYNERLDNLEITVCHPEATRDSLGFLTVRGRRLPLEGRRTYRVFAGSFSLGGRWYGPFWQSLPSVVRATGLRINGESLVEEDYRACHLRILLRLARAPSLNPAIDPFELPPFPRKHIKLGFNILLNASGKREALHALAHKLASGQAPPALAEAQAILETVEKAFPQLQRYWYRCFGLKLQHIDSEICGRVLALLADGGIPVLSVHDSFLVPARHRAVLLDAMEEGLNAELVARKR